MPVKSVSIRLPIRTGGDVTVHYDGNPTDQDVRDVSDLAVSIASRQEARQLAVSAWRDTCSHLESRARHLGEELEALQSRIKGYSRKLCTIPEKHTRRREDTTRAQREAIGRYDEMSRELDEVRAKHREVVDSKPK